MNTLNNLKNQFGQELSRVELKNVSGGSEPPNHFTCWCLDGSGAGASTGPNTEFEDIIKLMEEVCGKDASYECDNV